MADTPTFVRDRLAAIEAAGLLRQPPTIEATGPVTGRVGGRDATLFCGNDYLALRTDPRIAQAAADAAEAHGGGAGSSRLIAGSLAVHEELEAEIADWLGTAAALVFPSGYQANLAMLQALAGPDDQIVSDALNHASLIDGCRLSRATVAVVPHKDRRAAERALSDGAFAERFLVGEGLYSMDGDRGKVKDWMWAVHNTGAHLLVDEAHALGVLGPAGAGVAAERGAGHLPLARVGTFGKALGAAGAAIATDAATRDLLVNAGRTYIFTTGLAPAAAGAALAGIRIARSAEGDERRARLAGHARRIWNGLLDAGWQVPGDEDTPIKPAIVGPPEEAMALHHRLLEAGLYAMAIRPPTVPEGTCRIRITLSAAHSDDDIDRLLGAMGSPDTVPRP
ncbi:MAG: aminotransferase class I/II-fold pyridoxal phosphate-dependent enzyme [Proteobacteria bacterium]|nr:aminotransferase class I/II-fold pyridoxal phosphate-dependent enzyme [Pseudomonadota bacterium]